MRDPFSWSFPLGRIFGTTVRVHLLFPVLALGMILRYGFGKEYPAGLWVEVAIVMGLLFVSVLLHEFGHCFGARMVEGDCQEILMWPLGGLAYCEVPHTPRANFICTAAGPSVNVLLCLIAALFLASQGLLAPFNPLSSPYTPHLYQWADKSTRGTELSSGIKFTGYVDDHGDKVDPALAAKDPSKYAPQPLSRSEVQGTKVDKVGGGTIEVAPYSWAGTNVKVEEQATSPMSRAEIIAAQVFWLNWFMLLLNLLPGFPLDGGQMLQSILWWRSGDYRQATMAAVFAGFVVMVVIGLFGVVANEVLWLLLAMFIYVTCRQKWFVLETGGEEPMFGYDFSQGYTSLERDQPAASPPRRKRPNFLQRWLQRRAQRKAQRQQETREAEERRMDELLEKVQQHGLQALTDEERRFLTRVSARYRNRN